MGLQTCETQSSAFEIREALKRLRTTIGTGKKNDLTSHTHTRVKERGM